MSTTTEPTLGPKVCGKHCDCRPAPTVKAGTKVTVNWDDLIYTGVIEGFADDVPGGIGGGHGLSRLRLTEDTACLRCPDCKDAQPYPAGAEVFIPTRYIQP